MQTQVLQRRAIKTLNRVMNIPKNQKELVELLYKQDTQINELRKAIVILERRLNNTMRLIEQTKYTARQHTNSINLITTQLKKNQALNG